MHAVIVESLSMKPALIKPWPNSVSALALPGKAPPSRPPTPNTRSCRPRSLKATAKPARKAAKSSLFSDDHNTVVAEVTGTYYPVQGVRAHKIVAKQPIHVGNKVDAVVDTGVREATMRNHTATHLLHAGLREVLGKHVKQAGSLVAPNHLRFDFSHFAAVQDEELQDIEDLINKEVLRNRKVETIENVPLDVAINEYHAMALFGEKYGDKVRVIRIGDFSTELCGGTHTAATGEIGLIKILREGSVSSGIRRVEAVTGEGSLQHFRKDHQLENLVASFATHAEAANPAEALKLELHKKDAEIKRLARELDQARMKSASSDRKTWLPVLRPTPKPQTRPKPSNWNFTRRTPRSSASPVNLTRHA